MMGRIKKVFRGNIIRPSLLTVFLFMLTGASIPAQDIRFTEIKSAADWEMLKKISSESGKKIFLDIYATWCGPCKMMDSKVYNDPSVAEYFNNNFINSKVDGESEFGRILARKFGLKAYPSMYFLGKDETVLMTVVGFRDGAALTSLAGQLEKNSVRMSELSQMSSSGTISNADRKEYLGLLLQFGQTGQYQAEVAGIIRNFSDAEILDPANREIIANSGGTIDSKQVQTVISNYEAIKNSWGEEELKKYLSVVFNNSIQSAIAARDEEQLTRIEGILVPALLHNNPPMMPQAKLNTRKIYLTETEQWDRYITAVEEYYKENGSNIPGFFYNEAYYIVSNQILNEKLLKQGIEWINRDNAQNFSSFFLGALINTYRKDYAQADSWYEKAMPLAITAEEKKSISELRSFIDKLKVGP